MNNANPKYNGRTTEDLKTSLRAINNKIDSLRMDAAILQGVLPLPDGKRFWVADEIDWTSPELSNLSKTYFDLLNKSHDLRREIDYREAIKNNAIPLYESGQIAYEFINTNCNSFEEEVEFFKKNDLVRGMSSLVEEIYRNPNFLNEVVL
jgi:hypothetical protein